VADSESIDGGEKATLEIGTAVQVNGDVETTTTNLTIKMPGGSADFPLPEDPEEMIEKAKEMVREARKLDGQLAEDVKSLKRKADEMEDDDDDEDEEDDYDLHPVKKARLLETQLKKEQVRKRALLGVAATLAIGYVLRFPKPDIFLFAAF
jgi:predicted acylesterase/phospholipase RssA